MPCGLGNCLLASATRELGGLGLVDLRHLGIIIALFKGVMEVVVRRSDTRRTWQGLPVSTDGHNTKPQLWGGVGWGGGH